MAVPLGDDCGIIGKQVGHSAKVLHSNSGNPTLTQDSQIPPHTSGQLAALSCGNVRMLAAQLVFLVVAAQAAMARDLCQLGECKCNGLVASCSGQDIKVKDEIICI